MNPQHKNPARPDRTATAPYNFVPLPEKVIAFRNQPGSAIAIDQSIYHDDRFTGWIDVELETLSPVYIRAGLSPKQYEKMERQEKDPDDRTKHLDKVRNRPEFAHAGDPNVPVIPGSSLRGMIRTLCEIIGHGKLLPVSDQALVYRAVGDVSSHDIAYRQELMIEDPGNRNWFTPRLRAGYIRKHSRDGAWCIQPAQPANPADPDSPNYARIRHKDIPANLNHVNGYKQAYEIYVDHGNYDFKEVRGGFIHIKRVNITEASASYREGLRKAVAVLANTGPVPGKATEAVIFEGISNENDWIRIPDGTDPDDPRDLVKAYLDQVTKTGKHNQKELLGSDQGVLRDGYPVMYVMEGQKLRFFGHTQMFRMPYRFSPQDMLSGAHKDEGTLDLAQSMFGTVRGRTGGAAGRVFVEDARLHPDETGNLWLDGDPVVMPRILSGPKPTTFQHYLTQPQPDIERGKGLKTYNDRGETTLRGHKLYWHQGNVTRDSISERKLTSEQRDKDSQHTLIKPVRPGVRFRFRIRFENLLSQELGLLMWSVKLPAGDGFAHKIGMGKPLGLGSVRLRPTLTVIEPKIRYETFLDKNGRHLVQGEVRVIEADAIRDFESLAARALQLPAGSSFADTPRMRSLLAMLSWPGPDPSKTTYMSIGIDEATNKITGTNEFKERPVLPDPLAVSHRR